MDKIYYLSCLFTTLLAVVTLRARRTRKVQVRSTLDSQRYWVQNDLLKQDTANLLATLRKDLESIVRALPDTPASRRLRERFLKTRLEEEDHAPGSTLSTYTVNKGDAIVFCLKRDSVFYDYQFLIKLARIPDKTRAKLIDIYSKTPVDLRNYDATAATLESMIQQSLQSSKFFGQAWLIRVHSLLLEDADVHVTRTLLSKMGRDDTARPMLTAQLHRSYHEIHIAAYREIMDKLVCVGAINWGLVGAFNYNLVELINHATVERAVYIVIGLAGLIHIWSRDYYLRFLGPTAIPCDTLVPRVPENADTEITLTVAPDSNVIYWAAEPATQRVHNNPWLAYSRYANAGVARANEQGKVTLRFRKPAGYKVKGYSIQPHIHYRTCAAGTGMMGRVQTAYAN
ncbi:hypothetical protein HK102_003342 [Quaeritorhiza haematococci]|nr:hypothetical protein HK102_003342 [Quaeritorhiza haematococci]